MCSILCVCENFEKSKKIFIWKFTFLNLDWGRHSTHSYALQRPFSFWHVIFSNSTCTGLLTWKWQNDCPSRNLSSLPYEFNTSETLCVGDLIRNRSYFRQSKQAIRMVCRLCILYIFSKLFFVQNKFLFWHFDNNSWRITSKWHHSDTLCFYFSRERVEEWLFLIQ